MQDGKVKVFGINTEMPLDVNGDSIADTLTFQTRFVSRYMQLVQSKELAVPDIVHICDWTTAVAGEEIARVSQAKIVFDEAVCEISNDNEINVHGRGSSCGYSIIYHNSSIMRFSVLREGVRGQRANRIIYDPNIDENLLREIALPMERPYMEENNGTSRRI